MSKPWERHEGVLAALSEDQEPSTRSSPVSSNAPARYAYPNHSPAIEEYERKKLKLMKSNSTLIRFVVGMFLVTFLISLAMLIIGGEDQGLGASKNPDHGGGFQIIPPSENRESFSTVIGTLGVKSELSQLLQPPLPGDKPMRSMLLFGPPGCGKTKIAKAAAGQFGMNFMYVSIGDIMGPYVGKPALNVRKMFRVARANQPCVLMVDEINELLQDRKNAGADASQTQHSGAVTEFLTGMNDLLDDATSRVYLIGATNHPEKLDPAAARRLELRAHLPLPPYDARYAFLAKSYPHLSRAVLDELADISWGFSFSDLDILRKEVAGIMRKMVMSGEVAAAHFSTPGKDVIVRAMRKTPRTVSLREARKYRQWAMQHGGNVEPEDKPRHRPHVPGTVILTAEEQDMADSVEYAGSHSPRIQDVFGLDGVVRELKSLVHQIAQPHGRGRSALLYGPSGTGKTTLARALSRYGSELNPKERPWSVLKVGADTLISKYQGETESRVASVFRVAEAHQPCIVLLDEIDGLFKQRNDAQQSEAMASGATMRATFLSSMTDLLEGPNKILVIGTTNHPEVFDSATTNRFLKRLYVPLPDQEARLGLFRHLLNSPSYGFSDKDLTELAKVTVGWTGSDITRAVDECRTTMADMMPADPSIKSETHIRPDVLSLVIRNHTPIADYSAIKKLHQWEFGTMLDIEEPAVLDKVYYFFESRPMDK